LKQAALKSLDRVIPP